MYHPDHENTVADALSHHPDAAQLTAFSFPQLTWLAELQTALQSHFEASEIIRKFTHAIEAVDDYTVQDGLLPLHQHLVIPQAPLRLAFLQEFHSL